MPQTLPLGKERKEGWAPAKKPAMVDWYAPGQLIQTGIQTLFSTALGAMIDTRRILSIDSEMEDSFFDYSAAESFSFDYLADTGDGWDSTYTMAYLATADQLSVAGEPQALPRSKAVIIGGDAVYPVANKGEYFRRLQWPFGQAADDVREAKRVATDDPRAGLAIEDLYIIPGNHDWYDGLGSLSRRFFSYYSPGQQNDFGRPRKPRRLGQFRTHQACSFFALALPRDWEIWAVDVQLGEDIDPQQYAFFSWRSRSLTEASKVLLCSAVPTIVFAREHDPSSLTFGLDRIRGLVKGRGARTCALLAGDIHNYQRYEIPKISKGGRDYTRHHVVCGGGGAFLHPNHAFHRGSEQSPRIEPVKRYPSREQSRALSWRILLFPLRHPGMCAFLGLIYLLMFWAEGVPELSAAVANAVAHPFSFLVAAGTLLGCGAFGGSQGRWWWGLVHGAAHVGLAALSWQAGGRVTERLASDLPWLAAGGWEPLVERSATLVIGGLIGGIAFGLYLLISLNALRMHHNEAFSTLGWPHFKSFLRCSVAEDDSLTVHVIGVENTAGSEAAHPVRTHLVERFTIS